MNNIAKRFVNSITKHFVFVFFLPALILTGCCSSSVEKQQSGSENNQTLKSYIQLALSRYGDNVEYLYNSPEKSFVLALSREKESSNNPYPAIHFFVFDIKKNMIIFEDVVPKATVSWKNDHQVEVIVTPAIISTDEQDKPQGYIFDIDKHQKTAL
ncbi:MAG: hypothetical protein ACM34K_15580 [Bacillota bacterium]